MATDNPFAIDPAAESMDEPSAQRRKRIQSLSALGGLGQYANEEQAGLQEQPLYEGETSKNVASPEAQEPSQLATERVQRAPSYENAQPLLGEGERAGNILTGEEGTYKPLSGPQRSLSLKDFFQGAGGGGTGAEQGGGASGGGVSGDVGGSGQQAGQAIGYSKQANQVGTGLGKRLAQLFQGAGAAGGAGASFPAGLSLYGSGAPGAQFGSGLSLSGGAEAAGGLNPSDYTGAFGSQEGWGGAAGGLGSTIGSVGAGVGGLLTLASLINSLTSGQTDTSRTGAIPQAGLGLGSAAAGVAGPLVGATAGLGLGGAVGAAMLPLLASNIVNMVRGPADYPYNSGQNISLARTRGAAAEIPGQLNQYLLGQNNPLSLIGLATGAQPLSPNNEVQFYSGDAPWQTDYYNQQLQGLLSGDPQSTQDFLRNVQIRAGGTGEANPVSEQVTDTYRRQLAHSLGLTSEQTQGMFGEDQFSGGLNEAFWNEVASTPYGGAGDSGVGKLQELMGQANQYGDPNYSGNFANYSPNYRDPAAGRLSPEQVNIFQQLLQEKLGQAQAQQKQYGQGGE